MIKAYQKLGQKAFFMFDAEVAHGLSIKFLKSGAACLFKPHIDARLSQTIAGLTFENPIGLAAGYDKNAEVPLEILKLGFGFTEVGTITPKAQTGNPKPRIFRLIEDEAVINRLGFNNEGHDSALSRLKQYETRGKLVGVNIGANKDSEDRSGDYVKGIETFYDYAQYFTANISSPNTPGLRDLQARDSLAELLSRCMDKRNALAEEKGRKVPLLLKVAPDLTEGGIEDIVAEAIDKNIDGLIVSNTTLSRAGLQNGSVSAEAGGLSGRPLQHRSNIVVAKFRKLLGPDMPIIGVGGVNDAPSATDKMRAGADLVQLYTGMVYQGPGIASSICQGLSKICDQENLKNISELKSTKMDELAKLDIPQ